VAISGVLPRLLVANRGEIAVRVIRTARVMGIETIAVYPADDADSRHVALADVAAPIPGAGPAAYLDVGAIMKVAADQRAVALHPGYGFLSENGQLAQACERDGVWFVGPAPAALALFGDKTAARQLAVTLAVPVLPGTAGPTTLEEAAQFMATLGPGATVMVKAVAGGGGRGMRPVRDPGGLRDAFDRCRSEARAAFGDGSLYVEQLWPAARHIEVQIVGDGTGAITHLWERDCSVQRRRQKLIEIGPCPDLSAGVRTRLHQLAIALTGSTGYRGLATVEFLVQGDQVAFLEVNPRIQVEHTVTEEILGLDLVEIGLRIAGGATLADLGLRQDDVPEPAGIAVQARVNAETLSADGEVRPATGSLERFQPPAGRGVRVDTHGYAGYQMNPRYDSLLAKVIISLGHWDRPQACRSAAAALREFDLAGVSTNRPVLTVLLGDPALHEGTFTTGRLDQQMSEVVAAAAADAPAEDRPPTPPEDLPDGAVGVPSPMTGTVIEVSCTAGASVAAGEPLLVLEAMKMEHLIHAPAAGLVVQVPAEPGQVVAEGSILVVIEPDADAAAGPGAAAAVDLDEIPPSLALLFERRDATLDAARPDAVKKRRRTGQRTARENVEALFDPGTFTEYGGFAVAAQRARRSPEELRERTPADGMVSGFGAVHGQRTLALVYDGTVLGGTQGHNGHRKKNRLLELAAQYRTPVVVYAEGGGGRPGETETSYLAGVEESSFTLFARLSGLVPRVAVVSGRSFAGNAALAGLSDIIIATAGANLGMAGPAMIEAAGLGAVATEDIGPMNVQVANGVVDVLVRDEAEATEVARRYLGYFQGPVAGWTHADQRRLRHGVPENRVRTYDQRALLRVLADEGSLLELRPTFGIGIITALARIEGRPVGVLANDPRHLSGAIDGPAADKAARFLQLCDAFGLPVVSVCDTPGFMVGPEAETTATVRRFSRMMTIGANATVPIVMVVTRKAYGLGAMAMAGGDSRVPVATLSWPTGEFGGMGLEGFVRLAYRAELAAIEDPAARKARYQELVEGLYEQGRALSVAGVFEIDNVIDPADTRREVTAALRLYEAPSGDGRRRLVEPW